MKTSNQDILTDSFLQYLLIKRHSSASTRDIYKRELKFFLLYLKEKNLNIETVKISDIREYLILIAKKRSLCSSTNSRIITVLRLFFAFAEEEGIVSVNPTELLENVKHKNYFPETINENQVDYFLSFINPSTDLGLRDKALFELIYSCGLRVSECCSLKIQNYYKDEKKIIVTGKGNKQRMIPVGDYAINAIDEYLEKSREKLLKKKSDYIFVSMKGDKLSRQEIWVRLKIYAEKAGLKLKVHTLRHSFASSLLKNGADLRSVQEFLGHSDIRTTEIYTHINTEDLYSAFKTHHPQQKQQV